VVNIYHAITHSLDASPVDLSCDTDGLLNAFAVYRFNGTLPITAGPGSLNFDDLPLFSMTAFNGTNGKVKADGPNARLFLASDAAVAFNSASDFSSGSVDVRFQRTAANTLTLDDGSTGRGSLSAGIVSPNTLRLKSITTSSSPYNVGTETTILADANGGA